MSLFDRLRRAMSGSSQAPVQVIAPSSWNAPAAAPPPPPTLALQWTPPGATVHIGTRPFPGGMIYLGSVPQRHLDTHLDGEVIDPALPVDWARPDFTGQSMDYWPAYHSITPQARAAYLLWLQDGRRAPNTYIGHVFLFFYGLERRVLIDGRQDPRVSAELPQIAAEVTRLLRIYGGNRSFHGYATEFQQLLTALLARGNPQIAGPAPNPDDHHSWEPPFELRAGLGAFAATGSPVPADWALAWAALHPEIYLRTPTTRCAAEFRTLFTLRYHERYGAGIVVRPGQRRLALSYRAASAAITDAELELDLPDVLTSAAPTRALTELVDACTNDLDAYSRSLGRQPDAAGTLPALAVLPADLLRGDLPGLRPVQDLIGRALPQGVAQGTVTMADVVSLWPPKTPGRFGKADAVGISQLLERLGVGIEPDVRMGGVVEVSGPAVLFRTGEHAPAVASPEYAAATALLHLAAVVSAADDDVSDTERDHMVNHLESSLHLAPGERLRLTAHLSWLLSSQLKLTGLKKRLAGLNTRQRAHVGEFATTIAAVDGKVTSSEIKTLRKIYTLLELDPESVYTKLHGLTAQITPAAEPVTVIHADSSPAGYAIPPAAAPTPLATGVLRLDEALIQQKMAESASVAALLAEVFADEPGIAEPQHERLAPVPTVASPPVATLDSSHSALVRALAERPSWQHQDFEDLCEGLGLLPEGALDVINEAAVEAAGEPVLEDEAGQMQVNEYALGELLA